MSVHVMTSAPLSRNRVMVQSPPVGPSKGLLNGPGKNNCFLNCAVQVSGFYYSMRILIIYIVIV